MTKMDDEPRSDIIYSLNKLTDHNHVSSMAPVESAISIFHVTYDNSFSCSMGTTDRTC